MRYIEDLYKEKVIKIVSTDTKTDVNEVSKVYYIELSHEEKAFVKEVFSKEASEIIISGGRMVLLNELKRNFNETITKSQSYNRIYNDLKGFECMTEEEVLFLKTYFSDLFEKEEMKNYVLSQGRQVYESYKKLFDENRKVRQVIEKNIHDLSNEFIVKSELKHVNEKEVKEKEYVVYTKEVKQVLKEIRLNEKRILNDILQNANFKYQIEKNTAFAGIDTSLTNISIIKGLSSNKSNNLTKDFYKYDDQLEGYGFRVFKINDESMIDYKSVYEDEYLSISNIENSDFRIDSEYFYPEFIRVIELVNSKKNAIFANYSKFIKNF
jgi:cell division septum initiation protein DivIVA